MRITHFTVFSFIIFFMWVKGTTFAQPQQEITQWWLLESTESNTVKLLNPFPPSLKYKLDHNRFIVYASESQLSTLPTSILATPLPSPLKIEAKLLNAIIDQPNGVFNVAIKTSSFSLAELQAIIEHYRIQQTHPDWLSQGLIKGKMYGYHIENILNHPDLLWIEQSHDEMRLDEQVQGITNSSILMPRLNYEGLTGNNITVGIGDNSDLSHIDFHQRVTSFNTSFPQNHGEHISGIISGKGIKDWYAKGFAPNAHIISDYFSQVVVKSYIYRQHLGMSVTNNSYGQFLGDCDFMGAYTGLSQTIDNIFIHTSDVLHVFAAANDGYLDCFPYSAGYATVNGGFASAKNNIVVANKGKATHQVNSTSSKGPTKDGRIKPEITAIGTNVYAPITDQNYIESSGTSMAGPNVAGAAILLQEFYQSIHNVLPKSLLIKNVLINGAQHLNNEGPNYQYGFGLLNTEKSKEILAQQNYFEGTISNNQTITHSFHLSSPAAEVKILLNWHDPPAHPAAIKALVHDLDLEIIAPDGTYLPWTLNHLYDQVEAVAVRGLDTLNNVEQVSIRNPIPGDYQIVIKANELIHQEQDYIVSFYIEKPFVSLNYPLDGLNLEHQHAIYIYWDHHQTSNNNTDLYYQIEDESTWLPIAQNINGDIKHYIWHPPSATLNKKVQFKVVHGNYSDSTDNEGVMFSQRASISTPPSSQQCWGSIRFQWNPLPDIDSFVIYLLQDQDLIIIDTISNTHQYQFNNLNPEKTYWYAVAAFKNGRIGIRSIADHARADGSNCSLQGQEGDLTLLKADSLPFARQFTQQSFGQNESIPFILKNLSPQATSNFQVHYQINQLPWSSQSFNTQLSSNALLNLEIAPIDLSEPGIYYLTLVIENIEFIDENSSNDTLTYTIIHAPNPVVDLQSDWIEDFEQWEYGETITPSKGMGTHHRWDFQPHELNGRAYIPTYPIWNISGTKSLSLDNYTNIGYNPAMNSTNEAILTLNLANYSATEDNIGFYFDYILHGNGILENKVYLRGAETQEWIPALNFPILEANLNSIQRSPLIEVSDLLLAHQQDFSSSFQIKFIQQDSTKIASINYGTGLTLDNLSLFKITTDLSILDFEVSQDMHCGSGIVESEVTIKNHVAHTVYDIPISLYNQNELLSTEWIDSLEAESQMSFTFDYILEGMAGNQYQLYAKVHHPDDDYEENNSSIVKDLLFLQEINHYPYFNNFDENDGGFMTVGADNIWGYGPFESRYRPSTYNENSGWFSKQMEHSDRTISYLYSPCFDISSLETPHLSFMLSYYFFEEPHIEIYDKSKVQYSFNGKDWYDFEEELQHYVAYRQSNFWEGKQLDWTPQTFRLPQQATKIQFRWIIYNESQTGQGAIFLDNIHLYDLEFPIGSIDSFTSLQTIPPQAEYWGVEHQALNFWVPSLNTHDLKVQSYWKDIRISKDQNQKIYPQMWTLHYNNPEEGYYFGMAILDSLLSTSKTIENGHSKGNIYHFDYFLYKNSEEPVNKYLEDNLVEESWTRNSLVNTKILPYDKGYIVLIHEEKDGELWLMDNQHWNKQHPNQEALHWYVYREGENGARVVWQIDSVWVHELSSIQLYRLHYDGNFKKIYQDNLAHPQGSFLDFPDIIDGKSFYRIRISKKNADTMTTETQTVDWEENLFYWVLFPNPNKEDPLNIYYSLLDTSPVQLNFINTTGQIVYTTTLNITQSTGHIQHDINHLPAGSYFIQIIQGTHKKTIPYLKL